MTSYPQKITFGEMREMRVRGVLIYCRNRCGHHSEINADHWADDVRLSDIEPKFVCTRCGKRGAEIRPNFEPARMGTNA
jgi:ribosomal protein L37E